MTYANTGNAPLQPTLPASAVAKEKPKPGSIDETVAMILDMSHAREDGDGKTHLIHYYDVKDYTVLYHSGSQPYLIVGVAPLVSGRYAKHIVYYIDGLFAKLDGKPDGIWEYKGPYEGTLSSQFFKNRPLHMEFVKIPESAAFKANSEFTEAMQWIRDLYRRARGREAP